MLQIDVQLVSLPEMRVASALGFGTEPEAKAWAMIQSFAEAKGIDLNNEANQTLGFNNPDPSPGSDNYGYEIWLPVADSVTEADPVQIKNFDGGTYATTRFTGLSSIGNVWKQLVAWVEDSPHSFGPGIGHCLEKLHNPLEPDPDKYIFDLYLSVVAE